MTDRPGPDALSSLHEAAHRKAVVVPRGGRVFRRVSGRAPAEMLSGLLAGAMPAAPIDLGDSWHRGSAPCSAMLTPKGRIVCDMRVHRLEPGPAGALLLDLPESGADEAHEHFGRYLPPRMARAEPPGEHLSTLTLSIVGPEATPLLLQALGDPPPPTPPSELDEDHELVFPTGSVGLRIIRSGELGSEGYDIVGEADSVSRLIDGLTTAGVPRGDPSLRTLLRIERGRPAFGVEIDADTMPAEAGLLERCVDTSKGCFTGQEVVVRIRDRGHVNRHLRGLLMEQRPTTVPAPLYSGDDVRPVGEIRSVADHPPTSRSLGLGFVRRELEPPCTVRVGSPDGPAAQIRSLDRDGWRFEKGDASFYP